MDEGFKLARDIEGGTGSWVGERARRLVRVGMISMWDCWVPEGMDEEVVGGVVVDPGVVAKLREVLPQAANRLWSLGFPSRRTRLVVVPRITQRNWITGGGVGGFAFRREHGMVVGLDSLDVSTVVHEHAHMFWFTMGRAGKKIFADHYEEVVGRGGSAMVSRPFLLGEDREMLAWVKRVVYPDVAMWAKSLSWQDLVVSENFGLDDLEGVYGALEAGREDEALLRSIRPHRRVPAVLRREARFHSHGREEYSGESAAAGSRVDVFSGGDRFLLELPRDGGRFLEYPRSLSAEEVLGLVGFDRGDLRRRGLLSSFGEVKKVARRPLMSLFANKSVEGRVTEEFVRRMGGGEGSVAGDVGVSFDEGSLRSVIGRVFSSFRARLRMRGRPEGGYLGHVGRAFEDSWDQWVVRLRASVDPSGSLARQRQGGARQSLGAPEGSGFRDFLASSEGLPSSYSAANVDELWAVTVERAAMEGVRGVNPRLRRLLSAAIHAG